MLASRMTVLRDLRLTICLAALVSSCAKGAVNTPSPLPLAKVVATPIQDRVTVVAMKAEPVGKILPLYVSIANGTSEPILESPAEIFLRGEDGNRVPSVPLSEATVQAGGSAGLASSAETAAAYGIPSAAEGATGGLGGTIFSGGSFACGLGGTIIGGATGLITGGANGIWQAHAAAEERAQNQILSLSLKPATIPPNGTESGYIFYPIGRYQDVQAVVGDTESRTSMTVTDRIR